MNTHATQVLAATALALLAGCGHRGWSDEETRQLLDLRLTETAPPADPSNRFADHEAAARLGQRFFFDRRMSSNGQVSCATCHVPDRDLQDGLPLARGVGTTARRTMPIAGMAHAPWFFWDGRKDSLWSQALGPLESSVEHDADRAQIVHLVAAAYREPYERVFGPLPDLSGLPLHAGPNATDARWDAWVDLPAETQDAANRVFANVGKAIATYERKLEPGPSRFDRYVDAVARGDEDAAAQSLDADEAAGLRLFVGKAGCTKCHNGPRLTNDDFANTGVPGSVDWGRGRGAREVLQDEFNCLGRYSDARPEQCKELQAMRVGDAHANGAFKVPSLRNVAVRAPYMHAGQMQTLEEVVDHYDRAPRSGVGSSDLQPLHLSARERQQLVRFLGALTAPLATDARWLADPTL